MTYDTIDLLSSPQPCGVMDAVTETERTDIRVQVIKEERREQYAAHSKGLAPTITFRLMGALDYEGEKKVRYHGELYRVLSAPDHGTGVDLVCGRWNNDV